MYQSHLNELHLSTAKHYFLRTYVRLPRILKQYKWMNQSQLSHLRIQCGTILWLIWSILTIVLFVALVLLKNRLVDVSMTVLVTVTGTALGTLVATFVIKMSSSSRLGLAIWEKLGHNLNALFSLIVCYLLLHLIYSQSSEYSLKFIVVGILPLVVLFVVVWFEARRIHYHYEYLLLVSRLSAGFQTISINDELQEMSGESVWTRISVDQQQEVSTLVCKLKQSTESYKMFASVLIFVLLATALCIAAYLVK